MIWTIDELIHSLQQTREQLGGDTLVQHELFFADRIRGLSETFPGSDVLQKQDDRTVLQYFEHALRGEKDDYSIYIDAVYKAAEKCESDYLDSLADDEEAGTAAL